MYVFISNKAHSSSFFTFPLEGFIQSESSKVQSNYVLDEENLMEFLDYWDQALFLYVLCVFWPGEGPEGWIQLQVFNLCL